MHWWTTTVSAAHTTEQGPQHKAGTGRQTCLSAFVGLAVQALLSCPPCPAACVTAAGPLPQPRLLSHHWGQWRHFLHKQRKLFRLGRRAKPLPLSLSGEELYCLPRSQMLSKQHCGVQEMTINPLKHTDSSCLLGPHSHPQSCLLPVSMLPSDIPAPTSAGTAATAYRADGVLYAIAPATVAQCCHRCDPQS